MLDIIITHYNEPWWICRKMFVMLDMQRIVNWDEITVTVVNDGGYSLPDDELRELSFPVRQIDIQRSGISAARNAGIDNSKEPWIMFCDCDDCFTNIYALDEVMSEIRQPSRNQYNMMYMDFITEIGKIVAPITVEKYSVFIHGKVYRRQFLIENGLRFDESISYGEDTLFNEMLYLHTDKVSKIQTNTPPYVWIRRGGSVTTKGALKLG